MSVQIGNGCANLGGGIGAQDAQLLSDDPALVATAALKEAVVRHAHAKQIKQDDEHSQK